MSMPTAFRQPQFRVTVNARCGRACFFCRPSGEAVATKAAAELTPDEIVAVAASVYRAGITNVKLTGGDPALYGPLEEVVWRLRHEVGMADIELISRHPRIGTRAHDLADAGVTLFNMSIDSLDPELHHEICGVDDLEQVLEALGKCIATGVPCKVNTVVMRSINDHEIAGLIAECRRIGVHTLKLLDVITDLHTGGESFAGRLAIRRKTHLPELYKPLGVMLDDLKRQADKVSRRTQGELGHPMTVLHFSDGFEVVFKDSREGAWYGDICKDCAFFPCHDALMALRLTSDARLQFCLLRDEIAIDLAPITAKPQADLDTLVHRAISEYSSAYFRKTSDG